MSSNRPDDLDAEINAALEGVDLMNIDNAQGAPGGAAKGGSKDPNLRRGTVVGVTGKDVFVDLGPRMQGVASLSEFEEPPEVGQSYDFTLRGREDELWLLSRRDAVALASWDELEPGSVVKARVTGQNTGGLELKIGPHSAFMPASQAALGHVEDLSTFLGQTMVCQVLEVNRERKRVVLSRRAVLEQERMASLRQTLDSLRSGDVVKGKVTRIEKFGAFVEIAAGVEGLVHVSNMSRSRVEDPNDFLKVGQTVEAMVLEIKEGGKRIGLGMKQLEPDPWDDLHHRLPDDAIVDGKVTRLMDFGAFVEIEPGVEGLLHVSQLGRERVRRPQDVVKVGDQLTVRVVSVDPAARRLSLSRLDPDGEVIGSEEAADKSTVREMLESSEPPRLGTNLGDLFKKALGDS
jgi:small subunit ribosomal protein S1